MKISFNIKTKITLWYVAVMTLSLCSLGVFSYLVLSHTMYDNSRSPVSPYLTQVDLSDTIGKLDDQGFKKLTTYTITENGINIIKNSSQNIIQLNSVLGLIPLDQKPFITDGISVAQLVNVYYQVRGGIVELMVILQPLSENRDTTNLFARTLLLTTPVVILVSGVLGFFLIKRMLRPLDVITDIASGINEKNLKQK